MAEPEKPKIPQTHPCGGCAKRRAAELLAKNGGNNANPLPVTAVSAALPIPSLSIRVGCHKCTRKHLASAWILSEYLKGDKPESFTPAELFARAEILWSESLHGYPTHLWLAVGCLAVAVQVLDSTNQIELGNKVKFFQKYIEQNVKARWDITIQKQIPETSFTPSMAMVLAHVAEAESECNAVFPAIAKKIAWKRKEMTVTKKLPCGLIELITEVTTEANKAFVLPNKK